MVKRCFWTLNNLEEVRDEYHYSQTQPIINNISHWTNFTLILPIIIYKIYTYTQYTYIYQSIIFVIMLYVYTTQCFFK